ncbi:unnamed protein product [Prunus armeniaca]|uniref:Uncharacterized protein n=1 Tax=Prunus armeniaca TaxID=36596 RepID=A0A6J5WCQ3_PRUAR|nr:unnamed protein product [Prunus armeniaca]
MVCQKVNTRSGSGFGQTVKYLTLLQLRRMMDGWLDGRKDKSNGASGPSHVFLIVIRNLSACHILLTAQN